MRPVILCILVVFSVLISDWLPAQQPPLRVRKSFSSLSAAEKASIRRGIQVMKGRPGNDPRSWQFQADMHGTPQPTSQLHRQCQHTFRNQLGQLVVAEHFLTWHRGYLFFFEKILREASGDQNLTLPYWNWTQRPRLPIEFRSPANAGNPLFLAGRTLNDGSSIGFQIVQSDLSLAMMQNDFANFQLNLEMSPHGTVHGAVGGLMGSVPTSANDPIFWLHHCNVDRNWDHWVSSSSTRRNPTSDPFLNRQFQYIDSDGSVVTRRVRDILTSTQLGYRYDDTPQPPEMMVAADMPNSDETVLATTVTEFESPENRRLGFSAKRVPLQFGEQGSQQFEAVADAASPDSADIVAVKISGITYKQLPAFTYGVYLNLPAGEDNEQRMMPHYVGSINFFGTDHDHGDDQGAGDQGEKSYSFDAVLDISHSIVNLRSSGNWDPKNVTVTLRPLAPIPPKDKEAEKNQFYVESANKAGLSYEKIELITGR